MWEVIHTECLVCKRSNLHVKPPVRFPRFFFLPLSFNHSLNQNPNQCKVTSNTGEEERKLYREKKIKNRIYILWFCFTEYILTTCTHMYRKTSRTWPPQLPVTPYKKNKDKNSLNRLALLRGRPVSKSLQAGEEPLRCSRLFKQSPVHRCIIVIIIITTLCEHLTEEGRQMSHVRPMFCTYFTCKCFFSRVLSTWCVLLLSAVIYSLLDSRLQTFNLLVVIAPLGHDPHRRLQLGLLGHGVVTLTSQKTQNHQQQCSNHSNIRLI